MYCPLCKSEIKISQDQKQIKCSVCDWIISAEIKNVECPNCKTKNVIIKPKNSQIWEVSLISTPCPNQCDKTERNRRKSKLGELYYLKCDERAKVYHPGTIILKCRKCKCILSVGIIEGINSVRILQINPLVRYCIRFSEKLAKKLL